MKIYFKQIFDFHCFSPPEDMRIHSLHLVSQQISAYNLNQDFSLSYKLLNMINLAAIHVSHYLKQILVSKTLSCNLVYQSPIF